MIYYLYNFNTYEILRSSEDRQLILDIYFILNYVNGPVDFVGLPNDLSFEEWKNDKYFN